MANADHLHSTEYVQRCSVSRPQGRGLSIASSWGWAGKGRLARAPAVLGFALTGTPGPEESKVGLSELQAWGYYALRQQRRRTEYLGEPRSCSIQRFGI